MVASVPACLALGLMAGLLSGLVGIGGGIIVIPALAYLFKFSQHQAQGTTLARMVPPIGLLAAWTYYRHGHVDLQVAAWLAAGFFLGGLAGSLWATDLSNAALERTFGVVLLLISIKMIFGK